MPIPPPNIRVIVRLPYNRPEEPIPDPPRWRFISESKVDWNSEKEQILWEVIAKSRAVEGAGTDWTGLAAHLEVPLPYLLYRAQARYEEDLRGLQGLQGTLSPTVTSPSSQQSPNGIAPSATSTPITKEYFPSLSGKDRPPISRKDSLRDGSRHLALSTVGRVMGVRARLNSLGSPEARSRTLSILSKKATSSSTLTLRGPRKTHSTIRPLSPTSSHGSQSPSPNDASSEDEGKEEEEERLQEEQQALEQKLQNLQLMMTREHLGLVSSPPRPSPLRPQDRGRMRPLSASSSRSSFKLPLDTRRYSQSNTPSHQSLSSASSPQGSIPSIPSPPPEPRTHQHSPMARHISPAGSTSPPAISRGSVWGQQVRQATTGKVQVSGKASERGSEMESEASSFSDLSEASLSASALESALMSNIRGGGGSRISSFARSQMTSRQGGAAGVR